MSQAGTGFWIRLYKRQNCTLLEAELTTVIHLQADEDPSASSASDQTTWKDDNDGFRDTARGPRKNRSLKAPRKPEAEPPAEHLANGHVRANGRIEDGRFHQR